MNQKTVEQIKRHEGLSLYPYKCTSGKITIGFGRNIEDNGISPDEAESMLERDLALCVSELERFVYSGTFKLLDEVRRGALVNMCYNIGLPSLMGFKKMWAALTIHDYQTAAGELLNSRYANQVPNRAKELAEQIRTGKYKV